MANEALERLSPRFSAIYATSDRPSIAPEKLLRALLVEALYSVRSERLLMERLDDNLLFRWFVGLGMDDPVWDPTTFTKNRDRLLAGDIAQAFLAAVLEQIRRKKTALRRTFHRRTARCSKPGRRTRAFARKRATRTLRRTTTRATAVQIS